MRSDHDQSRAPGTSRSVGRMTPYSRLDAADYLQLCREAIRAAEQATDPASARRHARRAVRLALLGERLAKLQALAEKSR